MRPGVQVTSRADRAARGEPTDNGVWFVTGFAERGPVGEAIEVESLSQFTDTYGNRVAYSALRDALETAFAEGLATAFVSRVTGPAPLKATLTLQDRAGAPLDTLRIDAIHFGDFGNRISVESQDGTAADTFRLVVRFDGNIVETHDDLTMNGAAARYAPTILGASDYVRGLDLNSATAAPDDNPAVAAAADLAGGTDDHANAVEADWTEALGFFTNDLGPGQVSAPGRTTADAHTALINHARANNRTAYLDTPDKANKATLLAAIAAVEDLVGSEYGAIWGSWFDIPGLVAGTTRAVPGSAYWAGQTAAADAREGTSGAPAAGEASRASFVLAARLPDGGFTDDDYTDLNDAGVNMARNFRNRGVQGYGFRTISKDEDWEQLTAQRLRVSLVARLNNRGLRYVFKNPSKAVFSDFNTEMTAECLIDYNAGALFGDTPEEAFRVDTGDTVNNAATIAAKEINAAVYGRFTPFSELVKIAVVKVPVTANV